MLKQKFSHLRMHSEYSISDSTIRLSSICKSAAMDNQPALGLTDLGNTFAFIKFFKLARKNGIKPILGTEVSLRTETKQTNGPRLILLCKNHSGYQKLCRLLTKAWLNYDSYWKQGAIDFRWFCEDDLILGGKMSDNLICLSGGVFGEIGQNFRQPNMVIREEEELSKVKKYLDVFKDNFYIEIHRAGVLNEKRHEELALLLSDKLSIPVVATHPIQYLRREDYLAHQARVAIAEGETLASLKNNSVFTEKQYFLNQQEMKEKFKDLPGSIENTVEIAKRCNLEFEFGKVRLPNFTNEKKISLTDELREKASVGLKDRVFDQINFREEVRKNYEDRLTLECDVIVKMGFASYFLIVADFVNWAKNNDVPVGPGRGSGAGSLVAYCLNITDVDPLKFALLFERFLNPERISMPDFDIDFCQEKRYKVIEYVKKKYGIKAVSQIITFGTMASRAVIRDAGRVLELPYTFCDQLSKLIPVVQNKPLALESARKAEPTIVKREKEEEEVSNLFRLAEPLEDLTRNVGMHAGGVLIAPGELTDFCPLYKAPGSEGEDGVISMFDKDDIEELGLVKFDFLGLRNLTILDVALKELNRMNPERHITLDKLNGFSDLKTYDLLKSANTTAVFQLESEGMKKYLVKLQPDCFEDIIAMLALYRPGPLNSGMVDDFIKRKQGVQKIDYFHDDLKECLSPTYGVIVYQEQVMQIAQIIAGYSLGSADILRRAMGKKKADEMSRQREIFLKGARTKGYSKNLAIRLFDLMEKFAEYGFNKSHTAAYAVITYQTAWFKAHEPAAFYSATLTSDAQDTDRISLLIRDCKANGLGVLGPSINYSCFEFSTIKQKRNSEKGDTVRFGLGAIKGVGEAVIKNIVLVRDIGLFKDFADFCSRVDRKVLNKKSFEALICAGAMDELHPKGSKGRNEMINTYESFLQYTEQQELSRDQGNLFEVDLAEKAIQRESEMILPWTERQELKAEKQALGFPFTKSFYDLVKPEVSKYLGRSLNNLKPSSEAYWVHGVLSKVRKQMTRRGPLYILELEDDQTSAELSIYSEEYEIFRQKLKIDEYLQILIKVREDEYTGGTKLLVQEVLDSITVRENNLRSIRILLDSSYLTAERYQETIRKLEECLSRESGIPVLIGLALSEARCELSLGKNWVLQPSDNTLDKVRGYFGDDCVIFNLKGE